MSSYDPVCIRPGLDWIAHREFLCALSLSHSTDRLPFPVSMRTHNRSEESPFMVISAKHHHTNTIYGHPHFLHAIGDPILADYLSPSRLSRRPQRPSSPLPTLETHPTPILVVALCNVLSRLPKHLLEEAELSPGG